MSSLKRLLNAEEFRQGLEALDAEMGKDPFLVAFGPIKMISAGGFVAVSLLKVRDSTGDLDYLLDPELALDPDICKPLQDAIEVVGNRLLFHSKWINEDMAIFVTKESRVYLFKEAEKQNIVLWQGPNLIVLAAPMVWALERKLRRIHVGNRDRKADLDMQDAVGMLKYLRDRNHGPLDREYIRTLNVNSFDVVPDSRTMDRVAHAYQQKFNEEIFQA